MTNMQAIKFPNVTRWPDDSVVAKLEKKKDGRIGNELYRYLYSYKPDNTMKLIDYDLPVDIKIGRHLMLTYSHVPGNYLGGTVDILDSTGHTMLGEIFPVFDWVKLGKDANYNHVCEIHICSKSIVHQFIEDTKYYKMTARDVMNAISETINEKIKKTEDESLDDEPLRFYKGTYILIQDSPDNDITVEASIMYYNTYHARSQNDNFRFTFPVEKIADDEVSGLIISDRDDPFEIAISY